MELIGQVVIWVMMIFLLIGAVASIFDDESGFGREFKEGIASIGPIFLPVAGIMCLMPQITALILGVVGPVYAFIHADPSLAATSIIAGDMGGYQIASATAGSHSAWILAFAVSLVSGSTIIFSIPVGLTMLRKEDHRYMALGVMAGLLAIPVAAFVMALMLQTTQTPLRTEVSTDAPSTTPFDMPVGEILLNLVPVTLFVVLLALGLRFATGFMVRAFIWFGRILNAIVTIALAISIFQYFTDIAGRLGLEWPLAPFIADEADQFRALEVAGYIGVMLAGAFPMVYAIRKYLAGPLERVGAKLGFSEAGAAGLLAGSANLLALFRLIRTMPARDKVMTLAFAVCGGYAFGDHLAFSANFQPNMVGVFIVGKLTGAVVAMLLARWLSVPYALRLDAAHRERGGDAAGPDDEDAPAAVIDSELRDQISTHHVRGGEQRGFPHVTTPIA